MRPHTLTEALAAQVVAGPNRTAVSAPDGTLTYRQLAEQSDVLADRLRAGGVGAGDLVVLSTGRTLGLIVGMVAIVKSGAAYLPVDPGLPVARLRGLMQRSGAVLTLTDGSTAAGTGADVLLLDGTGPDPVVRGEAPVAGPAEPPAYVIYTSGSTGEPKGVAVSHRNVLALLDQLDETFGFSGDDVWTNFHSAAFDFSVWEIWGALLHGGRLVIVSEQDARSPAAFAALLAEQRVSVLSQTPSAFLALLGALCADPTAVPALRLVMLGGERVVLPSLRTWFETFGDRPQLANLYGITECTVFSCARVLTKADLDRPEASPIGTPLPGNRFLVLDTAGQPVPDGRPGELYVLGPTVGLGYLGDAGADRFAPCPSAGGERAYRTGDLVASEPDGDHLFLGRTDRQLKVRGYRVDPIEIEQHLAALDAVGAAAVVARDHGDGDTRLVAHLAPPAGLPADPAWREHAVAQARQELGRQLPASLCPSAYETHEVLPRTTNGKVDLAALAARPVADDRSDAVVAEGGPAGEIAAIWQSVLDVEDFDADDDFFDLGGTSLSLIRMFEQVNSNFGLRMDIQVLFDGVTVTALSAAVEAARSEPTSPMSEMAVDR